MYRAPTREKSEDIGPFRLVLRKAAKNFGKFRPGAKAALEGARIVLAEMPVGATGRYFAFFADNEGPIFEKFAVLEAQVQRVGDKSCSANRIIPSGEELRDLTLGDFREQNKFRSRGRASRSPGDGGYGIEDELLVEWWPIGWLLAGGRCHGVLVGWKERSFGSRIASG